MKTKTLILAALASLGLGSMAHAQYYTNRLVSHHALEVEHETERGKYYTVQASQDLVTWTNVGDPYFGDGKRNHHLFRTQDDNGTNTHLYYRTAVVPGTNLDLAPWSFAGVKISLNSDGIPEYLSLSTETNGMKVEGMETNYFTYAFSRTAESEVKLDMATGYYGRRWVYTFAFSSPVMGTYVKEEFRSGRVKHRDYGAFQVLDGITNAPGNTNYPSGGTNLPPTGTNAIPTEPPTSLAGLAYLFQTGETPDRLEFLTATNGVEFEDNLKSGDDNPDKFISYSYSLTTSNTATLVVYRGSDRDDYALTFTQGAQGTFIRREFRDGVLHDTDIGAFSPSSVSLQQTPTGNPGGSGTNAVPPTALTGQSYNVSSGGTPDRLEFTTANSGLLYGDNTTPNSFTYTYTATGPNTASVVVRVKVDRWDEYDWTFIGEGTGTFVRREFRNSVLNDTDTGSFTRVAAN